MRLSINGFGRMGQCFLRAAFDKGVEFDIVAINGLVPPETIAYLMRYDTTFGKWDKKVEVTDDSVIVEGSEIKTVSDRDPLNLPWEDLDVDLVLEGTGSLRTREDAAKHLDSGAGKVLVTAPCKGSDITIIPGFNNDQYNPEEHVIIDMGSCTTNCLVPVVHVLDEKFGIEKALMTTVHAYTNDQKLIDVKHSKIRRGRSATHSIIPTTTGAAISTCEVMPHLKGRLHGISIRAPVIDASVVDLVTVLREEVTEKKVNSEFRKSAKGRLKGILDYTEEPLVSVDYIGNPHSATIDGSFTTVRGGDLVKVLAWYDNEWGYSNRLVEMAVQMSEHMN